MRGRYRHTRRREIAPGPDGAMAPEDVAEKASYVGSPEHKDHPSAAGPPALRSDATPCAAHLTEDMTANTEALREGIRRCCTSATFEGAFPKYVWAWRDGELYEARHINGPQGTYKAYHIEEVEYPRDPEGRLNWGAPSDL
jgi:hypothetical protein